MPSTTINIHSTTRLHSTRPFSISSCNGPCTQGRHLRLCFPPHLPLCLLRHPSHSPPRIRHCCPAPPRRAYVSLFTRFSHLCSVRDTGTHSTLDSLVAAGVFWRLLSRIARVGLVHFSRLPRRLSRIAQGKAFIPGFYFETGTHTISPNHVISACAGNQRSQERLKRERRHCGLVHTFSLHVASHAP